VRNTDEGEGLGMKHLIKKLLCLLFIHQFETVDTENQYETVVCERCGTTWLVDLKQHTMEPLKAVT
jgi:hypothetical protein